MKKRLLLWLIPIFLTGCSSQPVMETVRDVYAPPQESIRQQISLQIPDGAVVAAMENSEQGIIYFCDGYTMTLQTTEGGDLDKTLRSVTGYGKDGLTLIRSQGDSTDRYDFVWTAAGESQQQVCRAAILDDGEWHYVLTCMTDADAAQQLRKPWQDLFDSFCVTPPGMDLNTGS